jgi:hypothetical protein
MLVSSIATAFGEFCPEASVHNVPLLPIGVLTMVPWPIVPHPELTQ